MKLTGRREEWPLTGRFAISRGSRTVVQVVVVEAEAGGVRGRGEATPYARYGETPDQVLEAIRRLADRASGELDRDVVQRLLPAGAARNAVDSSLWDLEAKRSGRRVWQIAGLEAPAPVPTLFTLGLDTPDAMARAAREVRGRPALKLKLGGREEEDLERVRKVRRAVPEMDLVVDANEGWSPEVLARLLAPLTELEIGMIEQPLPAEEDEALRHLDSPIPICADESCHDRATLRGLEEKYDLINVKLDKTGGLTEALEVVRVARDTGLDFMVGCMLGTSLAMAPAQILARGARWVDLDAPLLLARDRSPGLTYDGGCVYPPEPDLWG